MAVAFLPIMHALQSSITYSKPLTEFEWVLLMSRPTASANKSGLLAPFKGEVKHFFFYNKFSVQKQKHNNNDKFSFWLGLDINPHLADNCRTYNVLHNVPDEEIFQSFANDQKSIYFKFVRLVCVRCSHETRFYVKSWIRYYFPII